MFGFFAIFQCSPFVNSVCSASGVTPASMEISTYSIGLSVNWLVKNFDEKSGKIVLNQFCFCIYVDNLNN